MFNGRWCWFQTLHSKNGVRHIDGLVQERRNSIANALELRLFCTNPSILRPDWPKWQTVFSNAFFKKSVTLFCPTSHKPNWANSHHWYRGWIRDKQATTHYLNQWWSTGHWRLFGSLGLNELIRCIIQWFGTHNQGHIDVLMQERRNSIANAQELRLSCTTEPVGISIISIYTTAPGPGDAQMHQ